MGNYFKSGNASTPGSFSPPKNSREAPPPVENLDDQFFASPTKTIDQYFDKKLSEYDSYKRFTDGAREFPKTSSQEKLP